MKNKKVSLKGKVKFDKEAFQKAVDQQKEVIIYTDGACKGNPGPGGWGAVLIQDNMKLELKGGSESTTNNRMEMMAAIIALNTLPEKTPAKIFTDSKYLREGITNWIHNWFKNNFITKARTPVKNEELWRNLYNLSQQHNVEWQWVKGHRGNPINERADCLARRGVPTMKSRAIRMLKDQETTEVQDPKISQPQVESNTPDPQEPKKSKKKNKNKNNAPELQEPKKSKKKNKNKNNAPDLQVPNKPNPVKNPVPGIEIDWKNSFSYQNPEPNSPSEVTFLTNERDSLDESQDVVFVPVPKFPKGDKLSFLSENLFLEILEEGEKVFIFIETSEEKFAGGWSSLICNNIAKTQLSGGVMGGKKDEMILEAVIGSLIFLPSNHSVEVYTHSILFTSNMQKINEWQEDNWANVKEPEKWKLLARIIKTRQIEFKNIPLGAGVDPGKLKTLASQKAKEYNEKMIKRIHSKLVTGNFALFDE